MEYIKYSLTAKNQGVTKTQTSKNLNSFLFSLPKKFYGHAMFIGNSHNGARYLSSRVQLIYIISGLSLSCRSNSEKLTMFKVAADIFSQERPFLMQTYAAKNMLLPETYLFELTWRFHRNFMCVA